MAEAGWYPDPAGSDGIRYFDGSGWTEHVRRPDPPKPAYLTMPPPPMPDPPPRRPPVQRPAPMPEAVAPSAPPPRTPEPPPRAAPDPLPSHGVSPRPSRWRAWHVAVALVVGLVLGLTIGGSGKKSASPRAAGSTTTLATGSASGAAFSPATTSAASTVTGAPSTSTTKPTTPTHAATSTSASAATSLLTVIGSGTKSTTKFKVSRSDWNLHWSYDCTSVAGKRNFQVFVYGSTGSLPGDLVNQQGAKGSDVQNYHDGPGTFYLQINSECSWSVTATQ